MSQWKTSKLANSESLSDQVRDKRCIILQNNSYCGLRERGVSKKKLSGFKEPSPRKSSMRWIRLKFTWSEVVNPRGSGRAETPVACFFCYCRLDIRSINSRIGAEVERNCHKPSDLRENGDREYRNLWNTAIAWTLWQRESFIGKSIR